MPRPHNDRISYDQGYETSEYQEHISQATYDNPSRTRGTHGMDTGIAITVYLTAALVASIVAGIVATAKRRHPGYWVTFAFLCPPLVLILLMLPKGYVPRNIMHDPYDDDDSLD